MYYVLMTTVSVLFTAFGVCNFDGGVLYTIPCIFGGVLFGHVLTEALNDPSH